MKNQKLQKEKNNISISKDELENLLKRQEEDILSRLSVQTTQIRQAPTPPPEELRQLKQIDKSLPDRIISMAEKEQKFRHRATYLGQFFGSHWIYNSYSCWIFRIGGCRKHYRSWSFIYSICF